MVEEEKSGDGESADVGSGLPKMKVWEEGEDVIVQVHISGIDEKDIVLEVKEDFLKINISKELDTKVDNEKCVAEEWEKSSFDGMVSLPCKVVPMLVHHSYDGKVLEVRLKTA